MANWKPSVTFALGLWIGGLTVGAAGLLFLRLTRPPAPPAVPATANHQSDPSLLLHQENARLTAETERLKQTVAELKALQRRQPVRRSAPLAPAPEETILEWCATVETHPAAVARLQELFSEPITDASLLVTALTALAHPPDIPSVRPEMRLELLADLAGRTTNQQVRAYATALHETLTQQRGDTIPR